MILSLSWQMFLNPLPFQFQNWYQIRGALRVNFFNHTDAQIDGLQVNIVGIDDGRINFMKNALHLIHGLCLFTFEGRTWCDL